MNDDRIRKSLSDINTGEKGWQKVLSSDAGSHSQKLAEKNLIRLAALRKELLSQLNHPGSDQ
jgi:hypothetical protein